MKPKRKITPGYANLTARIPSEKLLRMVDAESSLERDLIMLLEFDNRVVEYLEQPLRISLPTGNKYTPDFYAKFVESNGDEAIYIYEVKYRSELRKKFTKLKPKFKAAIKYCKLHGYHFRILTENEIRTPRLKNIEFLQYFMRTSSDSEDELRCLLSNSLKELGASSPEELLAFSFSTKFEKAHATPVMWRMVAEGAIKTDLDVELTMKSLFTLCSDIGDKLW